MASNSSAVLDVVVENKEIPSFIKENKDLDLSLCSDLNFDSSLVCMSFYLLIQIP